MSGREHVEPAGAPRRKLTWDDYAQFPDDGQRHELIDGEHVVTPTPRLSHQRIAGSLYLALGNYLAQHRCGEVYFAPLDVILSRHDVVEPDLLYISNERKGIMKDWVRGSPDLVIEILSPSTRALDERTKLGRYEHFDVTEYWIVDPVDEAVVVRRRGEEGRFSKIIKYGRRDNATLTTPLLPGFELCVADLFRTSPG